MVVAEIYSNLESKLGEAMIIQISMISLWKKKKLGLITCICNTYASSKAHHCKALATVNAYNLYCVKYKLKK